MANTQQPPAVVSPGDPRGWSASAALALVIDPGAGDDHLGPLEAIGAAAMDGMHGVDALEGADLLDALEAAAHADEDASDMGAADGPGAHDATESGLIVCARELAALTRTGAVDTQTLAPYRTGIATLAELAVQDGHLGLADVCLLYQQALDALCGSGDALDDEVQESLRAWPVLLQGYLRGEDVTAGRAVVQHLRHPAFGDLVTDTDAEVLAAMLTAWADENAPAQGASEGAAAVGPNADAEVPVGTPARAQPETDRAPGEGEVAEPLPPGLQELVDLLLGELTAIDREAGQVLVVAVEHPEEPIRRSALIRLDEHLERFGAAAEVAGFPGLQAACAHTRANLGVLAQRGTPLTDAESAAIRGWPAHVRTYLRAPTRRSSAQALVEALGAPAWPASLSGPAADVLRDALVVADLKAVVPEKPARAQTASPEDISLALPEDVSADLLDAMLQELPSQTEELSAAIQRLRTGGTPADLAIAQRIAHTLKGAGNTVGVRGIAVLTHALEDILLALKARSALPPGALADSMLTAADCLEAMSESLIGGSSPPTDALQVLQDILDWANRIDREGLPLEAAPPSPEPALQPPPGASESERPPSPEGRREAEAADTAAVIRVPAALVDDLLRLVGETMILTGQVQERLRRTSEQTRAMQGQFALLQQLGHELEEIIEVKDMGLLSRAQPQHARSDALQLDQHFDALELDQYSELHTCARRLAEAATDAREFGVTVSGHLADLEDMLVGHERLNRETQESVLRTRMVLVRSVFPRLQRGVRQACRLTGKQVEVHLSGGTTAMDNDVLDDVIDPIMHVLRNAVDHGIEAATERSARGKPVTGNIWIDFAREGNSILIQCRDDGAGLDFEAIRRTAEEQGLVAPGQEVSLDELKRLVLRPNFSTRKAVTQTSGRGIGMDAVYTRVIELGGSLTMSSDPGRGLVVELRLPVTLISSHALLVRVASQVLAVANRGVQQILPPDGGEVRQLGDQPVLQLADRVYPARRLESLIGVSVGTAGAERGARPVLLVQGEQGTTAVLVEVLVESRDLVVKSLGRYLPRLRGIVGATILGDGSVAPVLDLPELLRAGRGAEVEAHSDTVRVPREAPGLPTALVVDDSLSARRALAQFMQDSGFEVRVARDGLEAAQLIAARRPDILLADLEMPRMNGIELAAHVRATAATRDLPIIMVTSRSTAKHRKQAEAAGVNVYLTKPFSDDEMLQHVHALTGVG